MDFNQEQIEHWIVKMQNKDEESFQAFYEEWYPKVFILRWRSLIMKQTQKMLHRKQ